MTMPKKPTPLPAPPAPAKSESYHTTLPGGRGVTVTREAKGCFVLAYTREDGAVSMNTQLILTKEAAQATYSLMALLGMSAGPFAMTMEIPEVTYIPKWKRVAGKIERALKRKK